MTKKRILLIGLLFSMSINLFFVGGIAYRVANFDGEEFSRPLPPNIGWVVHDLEESRRSELEPQLRESFAEIFPIRREMMSAQRQVNNLMSARPFDANALNVALASLREANIRYQALSHDQASEILGLLSDDERQAALEFVQRRGPRDGRDGFRGRDGGPGFRRPGRPGGRRPPDSPLPADANQ